MLIKLSLNLEQSNIFDFFLTIDRFFIIQSSVSFSDVPSVKYTEDDYYETTEKQLVDSQDYIVAICDDFEEAVSYCEKLRRNYEYIKKINNYSEEYSYTRYYLRVYDYFDECFKAVNYE